MTSRKYRNRKISLALAILVSSLISSSIVFVLCLVVARPLVSKYVQGQVRGHQETVSSYAKDSISQQLLMGDGPEVLRKCHFLLEDADLISIRVNDLSGEAVCDLKKENVTNTPFRSVDVPIYFDSSEQKIATTMRLQFSTKTEEDLTFFTTITAAVATLMLFGFQILFTMPLLKHVLRPLTALSKAVSNKNPEEIELPSLARNSLLVYEVDMIFKSIESSMAHFRDYRAKLVESTRFEAIAHTAQAIAHDLRAPLGVFERLLLITNEEFLSQRQKIKDSLNRLYSMIDSFRYVEADLLVSIDRVSFDLSFVKQTLSSKAQMMSIHLIVPQVSFKKLRIDAGKVERACINLASNAIEFARTSVKFEADINGNDFILRVIDDGPGVPEELLPRLFQRGATFGKHDGTGLGLAYVRQIMRGHGGDITYRRENGMTIFECYLPNAVDELTKDDHSKLLEPKGDTETSEHSRPVIRQVSICFVSSELNKRVFARLSCLPQDSYNFVLGFSQESTIVLTDSEEIAGHLPSRKVRPILINSLSDDEIVRRAPIRLGIKG